MVYSELNRRSFAAGLFVAAALIVTDYMALNYGTSEVDVFVLSLPLSLMLSAFFVTSLGGGYIMGKAYVENSPIKVWTFGGGWLASIAGSFIISLPYGFMQSVISPLSFFIGGLGLFDFRRNQGNRGVDGLLITVMTINTMLNLMYFVLGVTL